MYIIDNKGNIDIRLTYDVSSVIRKGFTDASSAFKDKVGEKVYLYLPTTLESILIMFKNILN